jgi:hypothetical protein
VEPAINENEGAPLVNEQEGLEKNEMSYANDHEEEPQQKNDESQLTRRPRHERRSVIPNDYVVYKSEGVNDMRKWIILSHLKKR